MDRQRVLFSGARIAAVTEDKVRGLLEGANPLLWHALHAPWDDFQISRRDDSRFLDMSEGDAAWWLHVQIRHTAIKLVDDCPEYGLITATTSDGQFYLNLRGELVIVFKKLVRRWSHKQQCNVLLRSNYPTKHNCEFWGQRELSPELNAPRVIVGYEPIRAMTAIRVHVGYPRNRGRMFDWTYEMPAQVEAAKRFSVQPTIFLGDAQKQEAPKFVVEPRRADAGEHGAV